MTRDRIERRAFIKSGAACLSLLAVGCAPTETDGGEDTGTPSGGADSAEPTDTGLGPDTDTASESCTLTADNIQGPFYISSSPVRTELDLYGHQGESLTLSGMLLDTSCEPIVGGVIEVWHARPDGTYDNASDEMEYRGQFASGADGSWSFHTLMPGKYLNGSDYRPAHIHVKVWVGGKEVLTTQLYFEGDTHLASDPWALPELAVALLNVDGDLSGVFDIVVG